MLGMNLFNSTP